MSLALTIHRSAHEIGGNCIELALENGERLLLDVGRPLDAPEGATGLLPTTLDQKRAATILISHPHQDHYGLLEETPSVWPIYTGEASEKLIRLTAAIRGRKIDRSFSHWNSGEPFQVGAFEITPFLTDHSAFDAYMLLIEGGGKRVLYSGDFRVHGRKSALVERLMASPPRDIDALLLEGTNLGSDKPTQTEADLEAEFLNLFRSTSGRVFVAWSAQNVDRTVTLYRAAKQAERTLVVDLYTAETMEILAEHGRLPRPGLENIKVVITSGLTRAYRRSGRGEMLQRFKDAGIALSAAALTDPRYVIMLRESLVRDYAKKGIEPSAQDSWCWSMWKGYLAKTNDAVSEWLGSAQPCHIHTSGHASPADLRRFAEAMKPKRLIPIHSFGWETNGEGFPDLTRLQDGQVLRLV